MGAYLSTPVTDKESEGGGDARYSFGVCAMQGWRTDMEDAHIVNLDVDQSKQGQVALFGVFDGHGGKEVAKFCAAHIAEALKASDGYRQGNYSEALRQTFLEMDIIMTREEHMAELEGYRKGSDDEEGQDGSLRKGETAMMLDSAQLPEAFLDAFGISRDRYVCLTVCGLQRCGAR
jgi:protein phosphatase 1G